MQILDFGWGTTTDPVGHVYQRRIILWNNVAACWEEILDHVSLAADFRSGPNLPSSHQLNYGASFISPISSEIELRVFGCDTVENAAQGLMNKAYDDNPLRAHPGLHGQQRRQRFQRGRREHIGISAAAPSTPAA
ncbi:hypothetical protein DL770_000567 [Monosporascus sp. CRB-9-2]|nr:hypothetical protein DL770_000567 [Monosporascus sp. CRB-9-2]